MFKKTEKLSKDLILVQNYALVLSEIDELVPFYRVKDVIPKFPMDLSITELEVIYEGLPAKRVNSLGILRDYLVEEQAQYLAKRTVDLNIRNQFRGVNIYDEFEIKQIVKFLKAQRDDSPIEKYDEVALYDYFWALRQTIKGYALCLVGHIREIDKYLMGQGTSKVRKFPLEDSWKDFNYMASPGESIVVTRL